MSPLDLVSEQVVAGWPLTFSALALLSAGVLSENQASLGTVILRTSFLSGWAGLVTVV